MFTSTRRKIKGLLTVVAVILFSVFSVSNRSAVTVSLFPFPVEIDVPLFLLVLSCFAVGVFFAAALLSVKLTRSKRLLKTERKHASALHNELESLKTAPSAQTLPASQA